jgi:hypothetical protein
VAQILGTEAFVQAWPDRRPGSPAGTDLFEDLPPA